MTKDDVCQSFNEYLDEAIEKSILHNESKRAVFYHSSDLWEFITRNIDFSTIDKNELVDLFALATGYRPMLENAKDITKPTFSLESR